jgi:hypothetical protein
VVRDGRHVADATEPAPTKAETGEGAHEKRTRYIAQRSGPVILRDGKNFVDATDPQSVGGPDGHMHRVEEAHENGHPIRFITCEPCAKALGWPPEGTAFQPDLVSEVRSRAMDQ